MRDSARDSHQPEGLPLDVDGLDEASAAVFRAFSTAMRLHRRFMNRRMEESAVHPGQGVCLGVLLRCDGTSQRDLAAAMHVAPPTLSRMLASLEKAGHVERRADDADQRLTRVFLTASGRALAEQARAALAGHIPAAIATLTRDERLELARLLDKLSAGVARTLDADDGVTR